MLALAGRTSQEPRQARWLVVALTFAAFGLTSCDGDDEGEDAPAATPVVESVSANPEETSEEIVIKTYVSIGEDPVDTGLVAEGKVLPGSFIGDSPFCPGGTFHDKHGNPDIGLVDRTFDCVDGSLRIGLTPGTPVGRTQSGPWEIISGVDAYEGLEGDGQMEAVYEPRTDFTEAAETFTGTVAS